MTDQAPTFWGFLWGIIKNPLRFFSANPLAQSAAAFGVNVWCLLLAVLAQFWVIISALLLLAQTYNTWLVSKRRISPLKALFVGLLIVFVNFAALLLAVLGQFWVIASCILSIWQYWCLIQVCWSMRKKI